MAEQDEVLSRKIEIAAKLEENGIAVQAKSRAVAALDRLVGSMFDVGAAFLEGVSRKKRIRDDISERLRNAQALNAEKQIEYMPGLGSILIHDMLKDQARKQVNAAGVAIEAVGALKTLAPPDLSVGSDNIEAQAGDIDEDWMNQFIRFAEDASSERLQQAWGRVLAGEVIKPGSFSRHALRFIAELDKETAENCEIVKRRVVGEWLLKSDYWNKGSGYLVGVDMQRLGVIEGLGIAGPRRHHTIDESGDVPILGKSWGILIRGKPGTEFSFEVLVLTRVGREVMSLLDTADEPQNLREVAGHLNKSGLSSINLGEIFYLPGGQCGLKSPQLIWQIEGEPQST